MTSSSDSACSVDTSSFLSMTFADRSLMYSIFLFDNPIDDLNIELELKVSVQERTVESGYCCCRYYCNI
jgi:hypothetical protein